MAARTIFIFSVVTLFALAYVRFTWLLDINFSGRPALVRIHQKTEKDADLELQMDKNRTPVNENLRLRSVGQFWLLYGILNAVFLASYFKNRLSVRIHLVLYLSLSFLSIALFGIWKYTIPEEFLFQVATKVKNFLLTPVYSGLVFIFVKYFDSFVENKEQ